MYKNGVFVSFDWDNDRRYKFLLEAWHANPRFEFVFQDGTPGEIDTFNVGRVKAALTSKIRAATHTLVIIGQYANEPHAKRTLIGYKNWINFEVAKSKECGNKLVAVKLDRSYASPEELLGVNASWALAFNEQAIMRAIAEA